MTTGCPIVVEIWAMIRAVVSLPLPGELTAMRMGFSG
jgi:hypothetical protein